MRIDELKRIAKENDYELTVELMMIKLKRKVDGCLNEININAAYKNKIWISIPETCRDKDFKMIKASVEFAETPPEDREEEKKFYLKHRWLNEADDKYLNYDKEDYFYYVDTNEEYSFNQFRFTLKEIEEIKKKFDTDLKDFELVEVEE